MMSYHNTLITNAYICCLLLYMIIMFKKYTVKAIDNNTLKALSKEALKHAFIYLSNHNLQCVCEYVSFCSFILANCLHAYIGEFPLYSCMLLNCSSCLSQFWLEKFCHVKILSCVIQHAPMHSQIRSYHKVKLPIFCC